MAPMLGCRWSTKIRVIIYKRIDFNKTNKSVPASKIATRYLSGVK